MQSLRKNNSLVQLKLGKYDCKRIWANRTCTYGWERRAIEWKRGSFLFQYFLKLKKFLTHGENDIIKMMLKSNIKNAPVITGKRLIPKKMDASGSSHTALSAVSSDSGG